MNIKQEIVYAPVSTLPNVIKFLKQYLEDNFLKNFMQENLFVITLSKQEEKIQDLFFLPNNSVCSLFKRYPKVLTNFQAKNLNVTALGTLILLYSYKKRSFRLTVESLKYWGPHLKYWIVISKNAQIYFLYGKDCFTSNIHFEKSQLPPVFNTKTIKKYHNFIIAVKNAENEFLGWGQLILSKKGEIVKLKNLLDLGTLYLHKQNEILPDLLGNDEGKN